MPSVGMRRSTRVLGARVLRSGRRLSTEPHEGVKHIRAPNEENNKLIEIIDTSDDEDETKNTRQENENENENGDAVEIVVDTEIEEFATEGAMEVENEDKMYGKVYTRRKRKSVISVSPELTEDKRFGKKYARKQWKRKSRAFLDSGFRGLAIVVNESSYNCGYWVASFLTSVLRYMSRVRFGIRRLSEFVGSRPICGAYSSRGVRFFQDSTAITNPGFCIIWGCKSFVPLFTVDFSAIPFSFVALHTSMALGSIYLSCSLLTFSMAVDEKNEKPTDMVDHFVESSSEVSPDTSHFGVATFSTQIPGNDNLGIKDFSPKPSLRNIQLRNSRKIQKRRSSLRRKRGKPPLTLQAQEPSETLASDFVRIGNDTVQLSASPPSRSSGNIKELNSDITVNSCSANLLIIETDKCVRDEGVTITLELSSSNQWSLAVMKNGIKRYSLPSQRAMRSAWTNRFSHATVWAAYPTWRLEFLDKQDWLVFKELYKQCSDRNARAPPAFDSVIPVPGVREVSSYVDSNYVEPYVRPFSYIRVKHDELTRALVKKSANYDMDSDDEDWVAKFNDGLSGDREIVTFDSFEMIIDALEKGVHSNQDEHFDEQTGNDFCVHIEKREMVVDAIRDYWDKKRKRKKSALVRIFELYQPIRTQVIPKPVLRKKRSFKRPSSQSWRGKQRIFLQAIDTLQKQDNTQKVLEAKAAAERYEGVAILKRQRAQMLMQNADLATYKAMMALKIAEMAQITETTPDKVSSFLLG